MERKRKLEVYEAPPAPAAANGGGYQQTAAPPAGGDTINPYTGRPYSQRYYQILAGRQGEWGVGEAGSDESSRAALPAAVWRRPLP